MAILPLTSGVDISEHLANMHPFTRFVPAAPANEFTYEVQLDVLLALVSVL
jgi:hypothetical protein